MRFSPVMRFTFATMRSPDNAFYVDITLHFGIYVDFYTLATLTIVTMTRCDTDK